MISAELNQLDLPSLKPPFACQQITCKDRFSLGSNTVLLVDDDRNTALFVRFALKHMVSAPALHHVPNGLEAIQYLTGGGKFLNRNLYPLPDLILSDLKMPLMDGFELLAWVRSQLALHQIPVVILSGSTYEPDAERALQLGANAFLIKLGELHGFAESLKETFARFLRSAEPIAA